MRLLALTALVLLSGCDGKFATKANDQRKGGPQADAVAAATPPPAAPSPAPAATTSPTSGTAPKSDDPNAGGTNQNPPPADPSVPDPNHPAKNLLLCTIVFDEDPLGKPNGPLFGMPLVSVLFDAADAAEKGTFWMLYPDESNDFVLGAGKKVHLMLMMKGAGDLWTDADIAESLQHVIKNGKADIQLNLAEATKGDGKGEQLLIRHGSCAQGGELKVSAMSASTDNTP